MPALLCVTPNPALDRTLTIPHLQLGEVLRPSIETVAAGGKGLNVARAVRNLGGQALCMGFLGGYAGRHLAGLAEGDGLACAWTWIEGETRTCVILLDPTGNEPTVINTAGPQIDASSWPRLQEELLLRSVPGSFALFSGSLPPGAPVDVFSTTLEKIGQSGVQVWLDTSGDALRAGLKARPAGIKVNAAEIGQALGIPAATSAVEARSAALRLHQMGIAQVVVTLGMQGALFSRPDGAWMALPPRIQAVNNVGSGDSFFGALTQALAEEIQPGEALRRAVAAGTANALSGGGGRFHLETYEAILEQVVTQEM